MHTDEVLDDGVSTRKRTKRTTPSTESLQDLTQEEIENLILDEHRRGIIRRPSDAAKSNQVITETNDIDYRQ